MLWSPTEGHRMSKLNNARLKGLPAGKHADGNGLYFRRRPDSKDTWLLRYTSPATQKRTEIVIGSAAHFTLAAARVEAARLKAIVASSVDPKHERLASARASRRARATLNDVAPPR